MMSRFYRKYGAPLLWLVAVSFPYLVLESENLKSNNDVETWLPKGTEVRATYERFKQDFGIEESIVVGIDQKVADEALVEGLALRLEGLEGVSKCWTPARLVARMEELGVPEEEAQQRLEGLLSCGKEGLIGVIAVMNPNGIKNRRQTVDEVRAQVAYCQLDDEHVALAGSPVIITELDRLGDIKSSRRFFFMTLGISLLLLFHFLRHWGLALSLLGISAWGIYLTKTLIFAFGGEMNFIMGALSIMVLICTLSIAIHFLSYYTSARDANAEDPLGVALRESWRPCALSTVTTLMGLMSLNVSTILPVSQFGYASALGSIVALIVGLGIAPALVVIWPDCTVGSPRESIDFTGWGNFINRNRVKLLGAAAILLMVTGVGILQLESHIDSLEFLPKASKVRVDAHRIEQELTSIDSVEAIVHFEANEVPFAECLDKVRSIEARIRKHPAVRHTLSAATFFPAEMPESPLAVAQLYNKAMSSGGGEGYLADGNRQWRISARIRRDAEDSSATVFTKLAAELADEPVSFTGVAPLLENAQREIFTGFWQSFTAAFISITIVMVISLRSVVLGLVAMVPNIIPIWLVFGLVGYWGLTVDIGMMMTGSIALGISVDCTFHFLVTYQEKYRSGATSVEATNAALRHSGEPLLGSTVVSSLGMLALCLSSFAPTARFGLLMAAQMVASLLGEMVLLPAILCMRPKRKDEAKRSSNRPTQTGAPKFTETGAWTGKSRVESVGNGHRAAAVRSAL